MTKGDTPLATEAEIQAALITAVDIPSLDDGQGGQIVPVVVPTVQQPLSTYAIEEDEAVAHVPASALTLPREAAAPPAVFERPGLLYRVVDAVLWAVNRPFEWLSPAARDRVAAVAAATIVISIVAVFLLPMLCPRSDVYSQIQRSRAAAEARRAAPAGETSHTRAGGKPGDGGEQAAGGHGGKPAAKGEKPAAPGKKPGAAHGAAPAKPGGH